MNKELSIVLRDRISDLLYVEKVSGLVQVFNKLISVDEGGNIVKKIPVTSSATFENCNTEQKLVEMIPDSSIKGMVYFEDQGINQPAKVPNGMSYKSSLRLVCWLNTNLISSQSDMLLSARVMNDIIKRLVVNPFNSIPFTRVTVLVQNIVQDNSIFSKYSYSEQETQYLMAPFEYFAIDFLISYTVPFACPSPVMISESPKLCL